MKPANILKKELNELKLETNGRKPDLAKRLVDYYTTESKENKRSHFDIESTSDSMNSVMKLEMNEVQPLRKFAGVVISDVAGTALSRAGFSIPTPIQSTAIPLLKGGESLILHSETGSGKTLAYLLPITERLWVEDESTEFIYDDIGSYALIMTPTRELAAQVAGIATILSPPDSVRLITTPTNLVRDSYADKECAEGQYGGRLDHNFGSRKGTKLLIGSAKSIHLSLFGDSKLYPPTSKPETKKFLCACTYVVLDEVDRLFNIKPTKGNPSKYYKKHDKPASILCSSIAMATLGKAQFVAVSATVGRPLRREFARSLALAPDECPRTVRPSGEIEHTSSRTVGVPSTLKHYVLPCEGSTKGSLLTTGALLVNKLPRLHGRGRKILFVISKTCGIKVRDAIGALKHFHVKPQPKDLLDVFKGYGSDQLIDAYRQNSGSDGLGERARNNSFDPTEGYLMVTVEDSIRGIHLDELDTVVVVGRPKRLDEYVHIAGRAGRAGKSGSVINILSHEGMASINGWEAILGVYFETLTLSDMNSAQI